MADSPTQPARHNGQRWLPGIRYQYRHELGSLLDALDTRQEHHAQLDALNEEMRDVVLHLVAAHHGYARPHFPPEAYDHERYSTEDEDNEQAAGEVMRRYAPLQPLGPGIPRVPAPRRRLGRECQSVR